MLFFVVIVVFVQFFHRAMPCAIRFRPYRAKKAAYRVPISRFFVHFYAMIATSFHGIAKSLCATTKYF
jgi:hypothetical protein